MLSYHAFVIQATDGISCRFQDVKCCF